MDLERRQADHVAAARADREREAATQAESQVLRDSETRIDHLVAEAERLIPAALESLAARKYEGIREVALSRARSFPFRFVLRNKTERIGGYLVCSYHHPHSYGRREGTSDMLLLTDGRLMPGDALDETYTVTEFADRVRKSERVGRDPQASEETEPFSSNRFSEFVDGLKSMARPLLNN
jgi:hypothetical protein